MLTNTFTPGRYRAIVTDYGWTQATTGTPQWFVRFTLTGRMDDTGNVLPCPRHERTFYTVAEGESASITPCCGG